MKARKRRKKNIKTQRPTRTGGRSSAKRETSAARSQQVKLFLHKNYINRQVKKLWKGPYRIQSIKQSGQITLNGKGTQFVQNVRNIRPVLMKRGEDAVAP